MRNLLVVVDYLPSLRDGVLQLLVNQMMKIDVSVLSVLYLVVMYSMSVSDVCVVCARCMCI